ncbi:MAG: copper amine oxidase N-terminal protein [Paenibacillaceae bacterium]|jgi:hypothetical protein|nr:copper amine oxidase N-terminal protein [Paenibacillaceae bacterium]
MRRRSKLKGYALVLLCVMMAIMAGCQAVGSVDLNKALLSSMEITSMEGSGEVEISFELDDTAVLTETEKESLALIEVLNHTKLHMEQIKQESPQVLSVKGNLEVGRGKIPFQASITPDSLAVWPEGADKPFVLDIAGLSAGLSGLGGELPVEAGATDQTQLLLSLQEQVKDPEFLKPLFAYLIGKLPNPDKLSLESGSETINGQSVYLHHVNVELKTKDIIPLLRSFVLNLMKDDQALKSVIAQYYDVLSPLFSGFVGEILGEALGFTEGEALNSVLEDKEAGLEIFHTEFKQVLAILLVMLNGVGQDSESELQNVLGKDSVLKVDLYADSGMKLRKSVLDLTLAPTDGLVPGVRSIHIKSSSENWNVNEPVTADIIPSEDGFPLEDASDPEQLLQALPPQSVLYQWLKDDLHITRKEASFFMMTEPEDFEYGYGWAAYLEGETAMVPARSLADDLGLELLWNEQEQAITLTVPGKKNSIVLTKDSGTAYANGKEIALDQPVALKEEYLYVPLRNVADAIGAKVVWDEEYGSVDVSLD